MTTEQKLREALQVAHKALEAISDDMTVGDRWTNAGQHLLDALNPVRQALALPTAAPPRIRIPTDAMEQEFQNHYRRGFEAGKRAALPTAEPVTHKPGCPADGGYGNGPEPCICGAAPVGELPEPVAKASKGPVAFFVKWTEVGKPLRGDINLFTEDQMRAALAGDARDAARYRWLRDNNVGPAMIDKVCREGHTDYMSLKCDEELDAAIDQAMARGGE